VFIRLRVPLLRVLVLFKLYLCNLNLVSFKRVVILFLLSLSILLDCQLVSDDVLILVKIRFIHAVLFLKMEHLAEINSALVSHLKITDVIGYMVRHYYFILIVYIKLSLV
jgi:hypothetical protein